jgi:transposase-like protein
VTEPSVTPPVSAAPGGERAVPFYCPYCGEEDLEPVGDRGGWWCHSCNRRFVLRIDGNGASAAAVPASTESG